MKINWVKGVIVCGDTPGFLGNRIGVYSMQIAMTEAIKMNFLSKKQMLYLEDQWEYQKQEFLLYMI